VTRHAVEVRSATACSSTAAAPIHVRMAEGAWTFRRRSEQLLLRREETPTGVNMLVIENGTCRSFSFTDLDRLVAFQSDMEAFLVRTGWTFSSFAPDRRRGRDRRQMPRMTERRRWWTDGLSDDDPIVKR